MSSRTSSRGISGRNLGRLGGDMGAPVFVLGATVDGASTNVLVDYATFPFRVMDCWVIMAAAGTASDTVKLTDGTSDITDAADLSGAGDTDRVRVGELDDANYSISKGGALKIVTAGGPATDHMHVYVLCART